MSMTIPENNSIFFQAQNIIPESEWDDFMATFRRDLPSTFRITGTRRYNLLNYTCNPITNIEQ